MTAFSPFSNLNLRKRRVKRIQEIKSKQDPSKGKVKTKREQRQTRKGKSKREERKRFEVFSPGAGPVHASLPSPEGKY